MLNTDALRDALHQLESHMGLLDSAEVQAKPALEDAVRTAVIKSFEYVYELSVRLVRRHLEVGADTPDAVDRMDFKVLMRVAAERGVVRDPVAWFVFRDKRNLTAHTYDVVKARDVVLVLPQFVAEAKALLAQLEAGHASAHG